MRRDHSLDARPPRVRVYWRVGWDAKLFVLALLTLAVLMIGVGPWRR